MKFMQDSNTRVKSETREWVAGDMEWEASGDGRGRNMGYFQGKQEGVVRSEMTERLVTCTEQRV